MPGPQARWGRSMEGRAMRVCGEDPGGPSQEIIFMHKLVLCISSHLELKCYHVYLFIYFLIEDTFYFLERRLIKKNNIIYYIIAVLFMVFEF